MFKTNLTFKRRAMLALEYSELWKNQSFIGIWLCAR